LPNAADAVLADASRVLCIGIGGGGDVAGTFALRIVAESFGTPTVLGGLTWERRPIDPLPGPRRLDEVTGAERLNDVVAIAGADTTGPGGFRFAESRAAELTGEPIVLVDPNPGPAAVGAGIADAARRLECDVVALLDVGGDVLAHGDEPGLASPLADATLLAAHAAIEAAGLKTFGVVFGAGCDGELTPGEVVERLGEVQDAGGDLGAYALKELGPLRAAVEAIPTEASAMALQCAEGETGVVEIRGGRRSVRLTPLGGELHCFDCGAAVRSAARLAALIADAPSLQDADALLTSRGVRTELAYERDAAAG
jgi:hypothetical protein